MRFNDDDPDVARLIERIQIRALERMARELRQAQRERRGEDDDPLVAAVRSAALMGWAAWARHSNCRSPCRR